MTESTQLFLSRPDRRTSRKPLARGRGHTLAALAAMALLAGCSAGGLDDPTAVDSNVVTKSSEQVTLAWDPPLTNEDGSALTDLSGYKLYYGQRSSSYEYVVDVKDPQATSASLPLPWPGTWYISAKSYTSDGLESSLSEEIVYDSHVL